MKFISRLAVTVFAVSMLAMPAPALEEKLAADDILISACSPTRLRAVTSLMVNANDIRTALDGIATALA